MVHRNRISSCASVGLRITAESNGQDDRYPHQRGSIHGCRPPKLKLGQFIVVLLAYKPWLWRCNELGHLVLVQPGSEGIGGDATCPGAEVPPQRQLIMVQMRLGKEATRLQGSSTPLHAGMTMGMTGRGPAHGPATVSADEVSHKSPIVHDSTPDCSSWRACMSRRL